MYADKQFVLFLFNNTHVRLIHSYDFYLTNMLRYLQIDIKSAQYIYCIRFGQDAIDNIGKNFSLLVIKLLLIIIHSLILQRLCLFQSTHNHLSCENLDTQSN